MHQEKEISLTEKSEAKNLKLFFILSYVIFWLLLGLTGYLISIKVPLLIQTIMKNVCAWTPTFVILILFKKLYPNITLTEYLKLHFMTKTNPMVFITSFGLQALVLMAVILSFSIINNQPLNTSTFISISNIVPVFILVLTSGALGEELGWRGYALNILQRKYVPLIAGLVVGLIWGLWHFPLMILSGYSGLELVYYIIAFMLAIISTSVIITFFYNRSKNIMVAMWIHFWFNFLLRIFVIEMLPLLIFTSIGYLVFATLIVLLYRDELLNKQVSRDEDIPGKKAESLN